MKIDLQKRKRQLEEEIQAAVNRFIDDTDLLSLEVTVETEIYESNLIKTLSDIKTNVTIIL